WTTWTYMTKLLQQTLFCPCQKVSERTAGNLLAADRSSNMPACMHARKQKQAFVSVQLGSSASGHWHRAVSCPLRQRLWVLEEASSLSRPSPSARPLSLYLNPTHRCTP